MATREQRYHQAAITYLVYGLMYLSGAVYLAEVGFVRGSSWVWFLVGVVFVLVLPPLIWKGFTWFTRLLAVLVAVRVVGLIRVILHDDGARVPLPWSGTIPLTLGAAIFALVAAGTCAMLIRAGWTWPPGAGDRPAPDSVHEPTTSDGSMEDRGSQRR